MRSALQDRQLVGHNPTQADHDVPPTIVQSPVPTRRQCRNSTPTATKPSRSMPKNQNGGKTNIHRLGGVPVRLSDGHCPMGTAQWVAPNENHPMGTRPLQKAPDHTKPVGIAKVGRTEVQVARSHR